MRILVTGADGFVGQHLLEALLVGGHQIIGGCHAERPAAGTLPADDVRRVVWRRFDLRDPASIRQLVRDTVPEAVVHLAGLTSVSRSWEDPEKALELNAMGSLHVVQALRGLTPLSTPRPVLLASSAEVYGSDATEAEPLSEEHPVRPITPYGASKAAQETMASALLGRDPAFRLIHTRSCQHLGPGQSPTFVAMDWARQLIEIRQGLRQPVMHVGDLDIHRDFLDVRDAAAAFRALLETPGAAGVFNVCSGRATSLRRLLHLLQEAACVQPEVRQDHRRLRPAEIRSLVATHGRITDATGWRPRTPLEDTVQAIIASVDPAARPA